MNPAAIALVGAITMYIPHGPVTFCGHYVDQIKDPWFALPVSTHGIEWECGDVIVVWADGASHIGYALDAGPFGAYCVRQLDGSCPPIAVDVPKQHTWFPGLSTTGYVDNVSAMQREWQERQGRNVY